MGVPENSDGVACYLAEPQQWTLKKTDGGIILVSPVLKGAVSAGSLVTKRCFRTLTTKAA
ncbi:hypothetical protein AZE42_11566 [Rhizopogon vesiculosus]|uniref:Uncharacterized protein n=1 Tax=Rhizopogon vesiculosus TaxID=180088 RepID=A0A1J8PRG8_9AGAM|nr:hypothetical protein AZE42_11566 [Rhizopogon vesiculosus]